MSEPLSPLELSLLAQPQAEPHRPLHPKHGPHDPRPALPARRANSIRRTTTIDTARPNGVLHDVLIDARGRDLVTLADGSTTVLATATVTGHVGPEDRTLTSVDAGSDLDMRALVGFGVSSGFRDRLNAAYPEGKTSHSVRYRR
jgi:hypothetical protein